MDINDLRTFVAVIDTGSVSHAANELHLTQPAVSRRLQRLERAVGAPLLDRRRRPFELTDLGRAALERCRQLVATADELRALAQGDEFPSREIRLGVAHALSETAMSEPVDSLRREFPAMVLRLHTGWSRDLLARVKGGVLDAAVLLLPAADRPPESLIGHILGRERLVVVAAQGCGGREGSVDDLGGVTWVLSPEGCAGRAGLQHELMRAGLPLRVSVETYNYELQLELVARKRGWGFVPERLLLNSPSRSRLQPMEVRGLDFPMSIWMVASELAKNFENPIAFLAHSLSTELSSVRSRGRRSSTV